MGKVLVVVIGLAVVASLLWIGGEMHYRNCVNTAEDRVPLSGDALLDEFASADRAKRAAELCKAARGCRGEA